MRIAFVLLVGTMLLSVLNQTAWWSSILAALSIIVSLFMLKSVSSNQIK